MDMSNRYTRKKRGNQDEDVQGVERDGEEEKEAGIPPAQSAGGVDRPPKIYTVKDIARILQFNEATIYRMHKTGKLPEPLSLGVTLRWNGWRIDDWVAEGCPPLKNAGNSQKHQKKAIRRRANSE